MFLSDVDQQGIGALGACRMLLYRNNILDDTKKNALVGHFCADACCDTILRSVLHTHVDFVLQVYILLSRFDFTLHDETVHHADA